MKKFLKILLIVVVVFFALLIIIPFAFKGKILQLAQDEINKNLNAKVEFADLRLSLIRNFPNLSVSLIDLSVVGVDDFENDTLVAFRAFRAVVDIKSVISGDEIEVRSILLDRPNAKVKVLADGRANWDIMIPSEPDDPDQPEDPDIDEEPVEHVPPVDPDVTAEPADPSGFKVSLRSFEVRDGRIEYDDQPFEVRTTLSGLNLMMKGDLTMDRTALDISATSEIFNFWFEGIRYVTNSRLSLNTLLDADLEDWRFEFRESDILLNELAMGVDGYFAMPEEGFDMDIDFYSTRTDFRTVLSLIPAIFMSDFEELQATGSLALEGFVRGVMKGDIFPSVGLDLVVENAGFSYPGMPKSVDNVEVELNLLYDGVDEDRTTVDLRRFHMEMGGNPFNMHMSIRTPMSDMHVDAAIRGTIDFTSLADIIPLEGVEIRGLLESDLSLSGNMSDIEEERYEDFNAAGSMRLTAFRYSDEAFPLEVHIPGAALDFSPRFVELSNLRMELGRSDITMSGRLENFIPYVFNDGTVRGSLSLASQMLDLNELIGEPAEVEDEPVQLTVIEVPGNIDFVLASTIDSIMFDNMEISNLRGRIVVRDSRVLMEGVNMEILDGTLALSGEYNTQDMAQPYINFGMDINGFDIPGTFHTFNTVQQITPLAKDLRGRFSTSMNMYSLLDETMMPVMNSIDAQGRLRTDNVEVVSSTTFDRLANVLSLREDRDNVLRDVDINFTITDGRVHVEPFETRMGQVRMVIGGDQGIDQTMNYVMRLTIPRALFGSGADRVINDLAASALARGLDIRPGDNINVDARITGTFSDPQISLDMRETARATMDEVREQIRTQAVEEVERRVEQVEERVREEISERADQILEEAERRAAQVKRGAAEAAETLRREAEANAARIEREAEGRGRLAEAAAKRTADGIRREADNKAEALIREADERAGKILEEARREAERIED